MSSLTDEMQELSSNNQDALEAALGGVRGELHHHRQKLRDLELQEAAYLWLLACGDGGATGLHLTSVPEPQYTLHEAMAVVLRDAPNRTMRAPDIAAAVNDQRLYRMRDGRTVETGQIHARTNNYGDMFEKVGSAIRLRDR